MEYMAVATRTRGQTSLRNKTKVKEQKKAHKAAARKNQEKKREKFAANVGFSGRLGRNSYSENHDDDNENHDDDNGGDVEVWVIDRFEFERGLHSVGSEENVQKEDVGCVKNSQLSVFDDDDHDKDDNGEDNQGISGLKNKVGYEDKGKGIIKEGENGEGSDDSLQILGENWDFYEDDDDDDDGHSHASDLVVLSSDDGDDGGDDDETSDKEFRIDESEPVISSEPSTSDGSDDDDDDDDYNDDNAAAADDIVDDDDDDDDDDGGGGGGGDGNGRLKKKNGVEIKKERDSESEFEMKLFEGLVISANPKNDDAQPSTRRTRSKSQSIPSSPRKRGPKEGTKLHPISFDIDHSSSSHDNEEEEEESDDDDDVNDEEKLVKSQKKPNVEGVKKKRGRPPKEKNFDLQPPLKRKRVEGLKTNEVQKILLNTLSSSNGQEGLDEYLSSTNNSYLPLKFRFGVKTLTPPEKTEEEKEEQNLWKELDFALGVGNIGSNNACRDDNEDVLPSDSAVLQEKLCAQGKHYLILDVEIGTRCKFCSFVGLEIKDVTPEFNEDPFGKAENRGYGRFLYGDEFDPVGLQFPKIDPNCSSTSYLPSEEDTRGTVWDLVPGTKRTLYPHQQEGFEFIWRNISGGIKLSELGKSTSKFGLGGCIICHAPGTGKTRLAIVFLQSFMKKYPKSKPVIVAPVNMLMTWEEEFVRWKFDVPFFNLNRAELSGKENRKVLHLLRGKKLDSKTVRLAKLYSWENEGGVLGIGYRLFEKLAGKTAKDEKIKQALLRDPGVMILDEGHTPRNEKSHIWKALSSVETNRRIILSGTPFQNNFQELYNTISLVREEFVDPLLAGCYDYHSMKKKRGRPIGSSSSSKGAGQRSFLDSSYNHNVDEERRIGELRNRIKPFVHIHKGEILRKTLRGLFASVVVLQPSKLQQTCLNRLECLKNSLELDYLVSVVSVHPSILCKGNNASSFKDLPLLENQRNLDAGVKTRFVFELIKLSIGEKVLVFSQYLAPLQFLADLLTAQFGWTEGEEFLYMYGKQEAKLRQSFIRVFNNPTSPARVLLASTKACCEGIHLVGASRVVLLDVVWNPSVERQAISRAYRLGQQKDVYVYHLITADTQEREKYRRQVTKDKVSELVFSSERESSHNLSSFSRISEDRVLEEMIRHENTKSMFKKIICQPKADDLIESFAPMTV